MAGLCRHKQGAWQSQPWRVALLHVIFVFVAHFSVVHSENSLSLKKGQFVHKRHQKMPLGSRKAVDGLVSVEVSAVHLSSPSQVAFLQVVREGDANSMKVRKGKSKKAKAAKESKGGGGKKNEKAGKKKHKEGGGGKKNEKGGKKDAGAGKSKKQFYIDEIARLYTSLGEAGKAANAGATAEKYPGQEDEIYEKICNKYEIPADKRVKYQPPRRAERAEREREDV